MKTINKSELIYFTILTFIGVLAGLFLIGASHQLLAGTGVTLLADFCSALCVALPVALAFHVLHVIIFRMRAGKMG